jgi:hypothetical protein
MISSGMNSLATVKLNVQDHNLIEALFLLDGHAVKAAGKIDQHGRLIHAAQEQNGGCIGEKQGTLTVKPLEAQNT